MGGEDQLADIWPRIPIGQGNLKVKTFPVSLIRISRTQAILAFGYNRLWLMCLKYFQINIDRVESGTIYLHAGHNVDKWL